MKFATCETDLTESVDPGKQATIFQKLTTEMIDLYIWFLRFSNLLAKLLQ